MMLRSRYKDDPDKTKYSDPEKEHLNWSSVSTRTIEADETQSFPWNRDDDDGVCRIRWKADSCACNHLKWCDLEITQKHGEKPCDYCFNVF